MKRLFLLYLIGLLMTAVNPLARADYSQGLTAYLNADYVTAKALWLEAAEQRDTRAMFNLGLLHEKNQLKDSNLEKASKWFRLAAEHGYSPANYHLAVILLNLDSTNSEAISLIRKASDQGYAPAVAYLNASSSSQSAELIAWEPSLGVSREGDLVSNDSTKEQDNKERQKTDLSRWIKDQPASAWTLQLLAFNDQNKVKQFIAQHNLTGSAAYFADAGNGEVLYKLVYGSFANRTDAEQARNRLPSALAQHGPWLRQFSAIHEIVEK